jgi:hypothetical protein
MQQRSLVKNVNRKNRGMKVDMPHQDDKALDRDKARDRADEGQSQTCTKNLVTFISEGHIG